MSLIYLNVSASLDQWRGLWLMEKPLGKVTSLRWHVSFLPLYMICKGRKLPLKVQVKVNVMFRLSVGPLIRTDLAPLVSVVNFPTETYELGV